MRKRFAQFLVLVVLGFAACGGPDQSTNRLAGQGSVFLVGTDAPMASVLAFRVTFTGIAVSDGSSTASILPQPQEVEFARLNGLQTLLAIQSVPAGSYTSVTLSLSSPVISFLDVATSPPSVQTLNGSLTQSSVTVQLRQPLVVTDGGLVGLHMDFRLRNSIELDANGQMTGRVTPLILVRAIPPDAPDAMIDELRGGVVSVNAAAGTFVMQGPLGRNLTIVTDAQTMFNPGESLATLDTNTIVEVSGTLQRVSLTLRATEVEVLSRDRFLLGGLITDVRPATGPANEIDLLVRNELPDLPGAQPGALSTLGFDGNERFMIHHLQLPLSIFFFNRDALVAGQRVAIGGALDASTNPPTLDTRRVILHRQGFEGGWVVGSTNVFNGNNGNFAFRATGLNGLLFPRPVPVFTSERTRFGNLAGLSDLAGAAPIPLRVVGLLLAGPVSGNPVIIASAVERLQ